MTTAIKIDANVMAKAIKDAALNRRAALNVELAVSCVFFSQEKEGADKTGRGNLKALYNSSGYSCMERADRDYVTVNRRITAMGHFFNKIGSGLVFSWIEGAADTETAIAVVLDGIASYDFGTLNDVDVFTGQKKAGAPVARAPRQPKSGPVADVETADETGAETATVSAPAFDAMIALAAIKGNMDTAAIRALCAELLEHCAAVDTAAEQAAAAAEQAAAAAAPVSQVKAKAKAKAKAKGKAAGAAPAPAADTIIVPLHTIPAAAAMQQQAAA